MVFHVLASLGVGCGKDVILGVKNVVVSYFLIDFSVIQ